MASLELVQTTENSADNLLTPREVAAKLNVTISWVKNHCTRTEPRLTFVDLGGGRRFRPEDIDKFIEDNLCTPKKKRA